MRKPTEQEASDAINWFLRAADQIADNNPHLFERCRMCDAVIQSAELCETCVTENEPFPAASKWRGKQ